MSLTKKLNEAHQHPGNWFALAVAGIIFGPLVYMSPYVNSAIEAVRTARNEARAEQQYTQDTQDANQLEICGGYTRK